MLACIACHAQTPAPSPPCTDSPAFYAVGASLNQAATPNLAGFAAIAVPLAKCGASFQVYSLTIHNVTPRGHGANLVFLDTTTTGAAIPLKQIGPIDLYAFGNIGVTTSGASSNLAGTYGGLASFPLWKGAHFRGILAAQKVEGFNVYGVGVGRSW